MSHTLQGKRFRPVVVCVLLATLPAGAAPEIPRDLLAARGKAATALVETDGKSYGSAYCIHSNGLFLTNEHVVRKAKEIRLILNSGMKGQAILRGTIVRRDEKEDLAVISTSTDFVFQPLPFAEASSISELTPVVLFGYPFGKEMSDATNLYPSVSVNLGSISALRRQGDDLHRLQLNAAANPGNSGGPILNLQGQVVGIIVARMEGGFGAGLDLAIPVNRIQRFLAMPVITFHPPALTRKNAGDRLRFAANAVHFLNDKAIFDLSLSLIPDSGETRTFPMKRASDGTYVAEAIPFPGGKIQPTVQVKAAFSNGLMDCIATDTPVTIGDEETTLSRLRLIHPGGNPSSATTDLGRKLTGPVRGLGKVSVDLGGQRLTLNLSTARKLEIGPPLQGYGLTCQIKASDHGIEAGSMSWPVLMEGESQSSLALIREGKFFRPPRSATPVTYLSAFSSPGDYIGGGKEYNYSEKDLRVAKDDRGISIQVEGWHILFGAPRGQFLSVGEYPNAKRHPFSDDSPGISFSGNGRGANRIFGAFAVWELELEENGQIRAAAIDYVQRSESENSPPLYGIFRYHSNFQ